MDAATLTALEDWLLERLGARCRIRPRPRWPLSADPHVRIDLSFDADRVLRQAKNVPRKIRVDPAVVAAVEAALAEAIGHEVPASTGGSRVRLYLPLEATSAPDT